MQREIAYDADALAQLLDLGDLKRLDDRMAVFEWAAWQDAEDFPRVGGTRLRVARIAGFGDEPTLRVFFEIESDNIVAVHWIERV